DSSLTPALADTLETGALLFSAQLQSIPANNPDPVVNASQNLIYTVNTISAAGLAVFDVTAAQAFQSGAGGNIQFVNNAGATTILINVRGPNVVWQNGNMQSNFGANAANVI